MVQGLREEVNGLVLGRERYHGNKNIASRSVKVSAREVDNFLFSSWQKERFLKN
jgi:hypothetical protein